MLYVGNTAPTATQPPATPASSYVGASGTMTACPGWPYLSFESITYAMAVANGLAQAYSINVKCPLTGRYVVWWQPPGPAGGPANVNLAEVLVYANTIVPQLVSTTAQCSMSSYYGGYPCTLGQDGVLTNFAHTLSGNAGIDPNGGWFQYDLGYDAFVNYVVIYDRTDCCQVRIDGGAVYVGGQQINFRSNALCMGGGSLPGSQTATPSVAGNPPGFTFSTVVTTGGYTAQGIAQSYALNIACGLTGRYVTFALPPCPGGGCNFLNLAEFQVFSNTPNPNPPWSFLSAGAGTLLVSQGQPIVMSSTYGTNYASFCNDGNIYQNGGTGQNFCNSLNDADGAWLTIDLGISSAIGTMVIYDRTDSQGSAARMDGFTMYVGEAYPNYRQNAQCNPALIPYYLSTISLSMAQLQGLTMNWAALFPCQLTGRYVTLRSLPNQFLNIVELQAYAYNSCPSRSATGAAQVSGSVCTNAGWGAVCQFQCNAGWLPISGAATATCNGAAWSGNPLVCAPPCQDLLPPPFVVAAQQTYYMDDFNVDGSLALLTSLSPWLQPLGFPSATPPPLSKWFQQDGMLQASANILFAQDLYAVIASQKINTYASAFTLSASVMTASRAGLVFRAQDYNNLYRVWFDVVDGFAAVELLAAGVPTPLTTATQPFAANAWHAVSVSMQGTGINVTIDGQLLFNLFDPLYTTGQAGVYAQSSAFFDNLAFAAAPAICSGMTNGDSCTFMCGAGLVAQGAMTRVCTNTNVSGVMTPLFVPDPVAAPLTCTLPPVTFYPSTLLVLENSAANVAVGNPLIAFSTNPTFRKYFCARKPVTATAHPPNRPRSPPPPPFFKFPHPYRRGPLRDHGCLPDGRLPEPGLRRQPHPGPEPLLHQRLHGPGRAAHGRLRAQLGLPELRGRQHVRHHGARLRLGLLAGL